MPHFINPILTPIVSLHHVVRLTILTAPGLGVKIPPLVYVLEGCTVNRRDPAEEK